MGYIYRLQVLNHQLLAGHGYLMYICEDGVFLTLSRIELDKSDDAIV